MKSFAEEIHLWDKLKLPIIFCVCFATWLQVEGKKNKEIMFAKSEYYDDGFPIGLLQCFAWKQSQHFHSKKTST